MVEPLSPTQNYRIAQAVKEQILCLQEDIGFAREQRLKEIEDKLLVQTKQLEDDLNQFLAQHNITL